MQDGKDKRDGQMVLLQNEPATRWTQETSATPLEQTRRIWPDAVALREVLQNPLRHLSAEWDLCHAIVDTDRNGFPLAFTGRFAVVFRLTLPGNVPVALRVFTSPDGSFGSDREARSERIAQSLTRLQAQVGGVLPPCAHIPSAVRVGDTWYPAQIMPWAEGEPLLSFVTQNRENATALRSLAATLTTAVEQLESAELAHGDLQHDNIMVSEAGCRVTLVDYDALYTPDLVEFAPPAERGHPNYQHPKRCAADYGVGMDRFPLAVIRTGLLLLANDTHLWEQSGGDASEGVLFTASDLMMREESPLWGLARQYATQDAELADSLAELRILRHAAPAESIRHLSSQTAPVAKLDQVVTYRYPSRVTPTCEEEQSRPISYLSPLYTREFHRQEAVHILTLCGYLLMAPPVVSIAWLMAWDAGGTKWPFLAYLLLLLAILQVTYLYLCWGVKRQRDALDLEYAKLREAERLHAEQTKGLSARLARLKAKGIPEPDARQEREHLRTVLAHVPISRSIAEVGVSAIVVRNLRQRGIETAAHLWQRHGFLPTGIDTEQVARLRVWLGGVESRERERYARESNPVVQIDETIAQIAQASEKRRARLSELDAMREGFPDSSFGAFLQRLVTSGQWKVVREQ